MSKPRPVTEAKELVEQWRQSTSVDDHAVVSRASLDSLWTLLDTIDARETKPDPRKRPRPSAKKRP